MQVLFIRKRYLAIGLVAILLFCVSIVFAAKLTQIVYRYSKLNKVVVVDAGHGSIDPGAHYGDLEEKTINLQVAYILKELLAKSNIEVVMTRTDDSLYNKSRREDIIYRARKTNEVNADAFISIHVNKYPTAEPLGGQAYYYSGETSKLLAQEVQKQLHLIQPENDRSIGRGNYYVLKKSRCPAVIVEIGFISNPIDRKRMVDPEEQVRIAEAIRNGLVSFFYQQFETSNDQIEEIEEHPTEKIENLSKGYNLYFTTKNPIQSNIIPIHMEFSKQVIAVSHSPDKSAFLEEAAEEAIQNLIDGPVSKKLVPVLPPGTELLSLKIDKGLAILNFNQALVKNHWGGSEIEQITVESITKTLTTFPGIDEVQLLIEGQPIDSIAGHVLLEYPLTWEMFE